MILGEMVAFSIGNGAEIWPLEKVRKCPAPDNYRGLITYIILSAFIYTIVPKY